MPPLSAIGCVLGNEETCQLTLNELRVDGSRGEAIKISVSPRGLLGAWRKDLTTPPMPPPAAAEADEDDMASAADIGDPATAATMAPPHSLLVEFGMPNYIVTFNLGGTTHCVCLLRAVGLLTAGGLGMHPFDGSGSAAYDGQARDLVLFCRDFWAVQNGQRGGVASAKAGDERLSEMGLLFPSTLGSHNLMGGKKKVDQYKGSPERYADDVREMRGANGALGGGALEDTTYRVVLLENTVNGEERTTLAAVAMPAGKNPQIHIDKESEEYMGLDSAYPYLSDAIIRQVSHTYADRASARAAASSGQVDQVDWDQQLTKEEGYVRPLLESNKISTTECVVLRLRGVKNGAEAEFLAAASIPASGRQYAIDRAKAREYGVTPGISNTDPRIRKISKDYGTNRAAKDAIKAPATINWAE